MFGEGQAERGMVDLSDRWVPSLVPRLIDSILLDEATPLISMESSEASFGPMKYYYRVTSCWHQSTAHDRAA